MNTKFGIDIVEVKRVEKLVKRRKNFLKRMFTKKEIAYCSLKKNCFPHYASRFAAKEAFLKAVSSGWQGVLKWTDIEIFNDKYGKPEITLLLPKTNKIRKKIKSIELTISQDKNYAVAMVAIGGKK